MIRITIVNFSDSRGGAAIAVRQLVCCLKRISSVNVRFVVAEKNIDDDFSEGSSYLEFKLHFIKRLLSFLLGKFQLSSNKIKHSFNIFSSKHVLKLVREECDVLHLHWINNETISIFDVVDIIKSNKKRKVIFTLHDEWLFCGSEHVNTLESKRYIDGYVQSNKENQGVDLDRYIFNFKKKLLPYINERNVIITAPSLYLVNKAKESYMLSNASIHLIPNIIDIETFKKLNRNKCRKQLLLGSNEFILLFGATGGSSDLKGGDLLKDTLNLLKKYIDSKRIKLVTFGGVKKGAYTINGFDAIEIGHIAERDMMARVYSCANLTIVPSKRESFGQVAAESLACETPVIAFDNSGIADIVQHEQSGYLAQAFDVQSMATFIAKAINLSEAELLNMGRAGRIYVEQHFSEQAVCMKWLKLYEER